MPLIVMSLRKALQKKNILVGKIKELQSTLGSHNTYKADEPMGNRVDTHDTLGELLKQTRNLVRLKTEITKANIGIYNVLAQLAETKSLINIMQSVDTDERAPSTRTMGSVVVNDPGTLVWIGRAAKDDLIEDWRKQVEELQEQVDEYNVETSISVELD